MKPYICTYADNDVAMQGQCWCYIVRYFSNMVKIITNVLLHKMRILVMFCIE